MVELTQVQEVARLLCRFRGGASCIMDEHPERETCNSENCRMVPVASRALREAARIVPKPNAWDRATELAARQLASFRLGLDAEDPYAYTENEKLMAGHIVGNLTANGLLNEMPGEWVRVEGDPDLLNQSSGKTT